jgi:hypothetical protein
MKKYSIPVKKSISDLKLTNPIFENFGQTENKQYALEAKHFGYYDIPV